MNWSRNRAIVACLLTAAMGLILCPPWTGEYNPTRRVWLSSPGHRLLWNGRGSLDLSRLALELSLLAIVGALATIVAPMVGHPSPRALKVWLRRAGLILGCAAVLIVAATAVYDEIVRFSLLRNYNRKVQEFQAKGALLQEAFALKPVTYSAAEDPYTKYGGWIAANPVSNIHEAEVMLQSLGCDERGIQRAAARFLSASTPEYDTKTLAFLIGTADGKGGNCPPEITVKASNLQQVTPAPTPPKRGKFLLSDIDSVSRPRTAPEKDPLAVVSKTPAKTSRHIDLSAGLEPIPEIVFVFHIRDSEAAERFFAPLPDWYTEALRHNIEVARVPDWMKPGEPPASWSFTDWLDSRRYWLILAAGMLALSVLCFVVASQIDRTAAKDSVGATA